jgi:hypothetical protein
MSVNSAISLEISRIAAIGGQASGRRRAIAAGQRISASSAAIALDICILINLRYRCVAGVDAARRAWNAGQGDEVS